MRKVAGVLMLMIAMIYVNSGLFYLYSGSHLISEGSDIQDTLRVHSANNESPRDYDKAEAKSITNKGFKLLFLGLFILATVGLMIGAAVALFFSKNMKLIIGAALCGIAMEIVCMYGGFSKQVYLFEDNKYQSVDFIMGMFVVAVCIMAIYAAYKMGIVKKTGEIGEEETDSSAEIG